MQGSKCLVPCSLGTCSLACWASPPSPALAAPALLRTMPCPVAVLQKGKKKKTVSTSGHGKVPDALRSSRAQLGNLRDKELVERMKLKKAKFKVTNKK